MRVAILLVLASCISVKPDSSSDSGDSAACVEWCPDSDGDGLGTVALACAPVCLPVGTSPDETTCAYVANCDDLP